MRDDLFKDIKFIEKYGGEFQLQPVHTIGWKFKFKENTYGNYIADRVSTGEFYEHEVWDEDTGEVYKEKVEIYKQEDITPEKEIVLLENMIETMKRLIKGDL